MLTLQHMETCLEKRIYMHERMVLSVFARAKPMLQAIAALSLLTSNGTIGYGLPSVSYTNHDCKATVMSN